MAVVRVFFTLIIFLIILLEVYHAFLISAMLATCTAHLIILTLILLAEKYKYKALIM
jgi:hypothetical protein